MDLQLHDGGYLPKRHKPIPNIARATFKKAYRTPTYYQMLNEYGLSENDPMDLQLSGWWDSLSRAARSVAAPVQRAVTAVTTPIQQAAGAAANVASTVSRAVPILAPTSDVFRAISNPQAVIKDPLGFVKSSDTVGTTLQNLPMVAGVIAPGAAKALEPIMSGIRPPSTVPGVPEVLPVIEPAAPAASLTVTPPPVNSSPFNLRTLFNRPRPTIAVPPGGAPPYQVAPTTPATPGTTFAGMPLSTLLLLGGAGFLAYKLLNKK
jgi:hypothetical protein